MVEVAFIGLSIFTILSAILALESDEIVYGAVSLGLSFLGIAGIFVLLESPFVAVFQILVNVGAVIVLILFTVVLVRREVWLRLREDRGRVAGLFGGVAIALGLGFLVINSPISKSLATTQTIRFTEIGKQLGTEYLFALEVLALLIASAVMGALTLAKLEKEEKPLQGGP